MEREKMHVVIWWSHFAAVRKKNPETYIQYVHRSKDTIYFLYIYSFFTFLQGYHRQPGERGDHLRHPSVTSRDGRREVKYCISKVSSADIRMAKGTLSITTHNKSSSTTCTWLLKTLLSEGLQSHLWMEVCLCCSIYSTLKYLKNKKSIWLIAITFCTSIHCPQMMNLNH